MREYLMAVALCVALVGCDSKPEGGAASGGGAKTDGGAKVEGGKPAEGAKSEGSKAAAAKHPWASFKAGSFVKLKITSEMEVAGNKMKNESTMIQTLKEVTADSYTLETDMGIAGVPKNEQKLPLKGPEGAKAPEGPKPKTGSEEIEVAGKKMKCTWTEMEIDAGGQKMTVKTWTNEDVPGFTVKSTSKGATSTSTTEAVEFSSKKPLHLERGGGSAGGRTSPSFFCPPRYSGLPRTSRCGKVKASGKFGSTADGHAATLPTPFLGFQFLLSFSRL